MKRLLSTSCLFILFIMVLVNIGCKEIKETTVHQVVVVVYEGVSGTPETGSYYYEENSQVAYAYTLASGENLRVSLDGVIIPNSGTFTVTGDHTLEAFTSAGNGDYRVHVSWGTGVTGTPEEGFYFVDQGTQFDYNFEALEGYTNVTVLLDGDEVATSGSFNVSQNHILYAYASVKYEIQGSWTISESYDDGSIFEVTLTFSGEVENGTVTDSDGGTGTYTVVGNVVNFTINYPQVTYEYVGSFSTDTEMSGTSKRYTSADTYVDGTWSAVMDTEE